MIMGAGCTKGGAFNAAQGEVKSGQVVPYIVVSSVSITDRIANEHMTAIAERSNSPQASPTCLRRSQSQHVIYFKDECDQSIIKVPVRSKSTIPYIGTETPNLTLHSLYNRSSSLSDLPSEPPGCQPTPQIIRRTASASSLSSQVPRLRATISLSPTLTHKLTQPIGIDQTSSATAQKHCLSVEANQRRDGAIGQDDWAFDDFSHFHNTTEPGYAITTSDPQVISDLIQSKLTMLSVLHVANAGPSVERRTSQLARECLHLYNRLYDTNLHMDEAELELVSNIDLIENAEDMRRHIDIVQSYYYCS